jgi:hypothetical protein
MNTAALKPHSMFAPTDCLILRLLGVSLAV